MGGFHPAHLALLCFAVLLLALVLFSLFLHGGWRRVGELYREHFSQRHRERQLVATVAFFLSFAIVRLLTHSIRAGRGPFHNIQAGGLHIHHLVWGILLLLIVGYGWLSQIGSDIRGRSHWPGRIMSLLYGVGAALTLDEFALWLNLQDVYWQRQGRESVDAVLLFGTLLVIGVLGGHFFHSIAREAMRPVHLEHGRRIRG
ncbi:MAG TPA: hypothetical protein VKV17_11745 [Bryobacteraceae bacterium]|nr:hypothetical protein [Bryobacteraceae bacterium]